MAERDLRRRDVYNNTLLPGEYYYPSRDQYEFKYKDIYGKPKSKKAKTLDALRKAEDEIEKRKKADLPALTKTTTVTELVEIYFKVKNNIDELTKSGYIYLFNRYIAKSSFAQKSIGDVYKINVVEFYNYLITEKKLLKTTVKTAQNFLSPAFRLAVDCRAIPSNPCELCMNEVKDTVSPERYVFPPRQQILFLDFVKVYFRNDYAMIKIMFDTAVRVSELCGLKDKDVNLNASYVSITHQLSYRNFDGTPVNYRIKEPKTEAGNREILFDEDTKICFTEQQKYADLIRNIVNHFEVDGYSEFLFVTQSTGRPVVTDV